MAIERSRPPWVGIQTASTKEMNIPASENVYALSLSSDSPCNLMLKGLLVIVDFLYEETETFNE